MENFPEKSLPKSDFIFAMSTLYEVLWCSQGEIIQIHIFTEMIYVCNLCPGRGEYKYLRIVSAHEISE